MLLTRKQRGTRRANGSGIVTASGHDWVRLEILREGRVTETVREDLAYHDGSAPFRLAGTIRAELAEYGARFYLDDSLAAARDSLVCGDALLISGQSNARARPGSRSSTPGDGWSGHWPSAPASPARRRSRGTAGTGTVCFFHLDCTCTGCGPVPKGTPDGYGSYDETARASRPWKTQVTDQGRPDPAFGESTPGFA
jgi:hypothetical protein